MIVTLLFRGKIKPCARCRRDAAPYTLEPASALIGTYPHATVIPYAVRDLGCQCRAHRL